MSEPNYVYFFIRADECSPLLQSAPDGEDAAEAIYERQAQKRFRHLGVEVLACEMPDWPSDDIIKSATEYLGQASAEPAAPPAAPVVTSDGIDLDWLRTDLKRYGWTRSVSQLLKTEYWSRGNNQIRFEPYGPVLNGAPVTHPEVVKTIRSIWRAAGISEAALRGADLAPEGARDDK